MGCAGHPRAIQGDLLLVSVLQVHQLKGERSFHIFYQLVRGAGKDKALKAELKLPNKPSEFVYLSKSGCMVGTQLDCGPSGGRCSKYTAIVGVTSQLLSSGVCAVCLRAWLVQSCCFGSLISVSVVCAVLCCAVQDIDGVDDAKEFAEVMQALQDIGVQPDEISTLLRTLSGILWLGNLKIDPVHANDSSKIKSDAALSNAAQLLSLSEEALSHAITHKKVGP
jgi:hypothetical protein